MNARPGNICLPTSGNRPPFAKTFSRTAAIHPTPCPGQRKLAAAIAAGVERWPHERWAELARHVAGGAPPLRLPLGFGPGEAEAKSEARPTGVIRSRWMDGP